MKHHDYIAGLDGPQSRILPGGRRILAKGGGGGERKATPEERRLWAAQASSLESLQQAAMPNLQVGMNNLGALTNESMSGTLAERLRNRAGSDVNVALGTSGRDAIRNLGSYGTQLDPQRMGDISLSWGLNAAKQRAGAMNLASMGAEDQKWQRNAALASLASGQGAQAVEGMSSLASQIGQSRMSTMAADQAEANNNAQSIGGLLMGGKALGLYKDGGEVRAKDGLRMYRPVTISHRPWSFTGGGGGGGGASSAPSLAGTVLPAYGTKALAGVLDKAGIAEPKRAVDAAGQGLKDAWALKDYDPAADTAAYQAALDSGQIDQAGFDAGKAAIDNAAATQAGAGDAVAGGVPYFAAGKALMGIASGEDPKKAIASGVATYAGSKVGAALGSVIPGVGTAIGATLGGLFGSMFADGGRVNMSRGGAVKGPGTTTSDSVPARLSDGEIVINARAVGLPPHETKKVIAAWDGQDTGDLLMDINDRGLEKRYGKEGAKQSPRYAGGEQGFVSGGLVAAGRGLFFASPHLMNMDAQREQLAAAREDREYQRRQRALLEEQQAQDKKINEAAAQAYDALQYGTDTAQSLTEQRTAAGNLMQDPSQLAALMAEDARYQAGRPQWQERAAAGLPAVVSPGPTLPHVPGTELVAKSAGYYTRPVQAQTFALPPQDGVPVQGSGVFLPEDGVPVQGSGAVAPQPVERAVGSKMTPSEKDRRDAAMKPKMDVDALFYKEAWPKLRGEYARRYGLEKAQAYDAMLQSRANQGYLRRINEAALMQKAGNTAGAVQKWVEMYNRDMPDGLYAAAELMPDGATVKLIRFNSKGDVVDVSEQGVPDMISLAAAYLKPEDQAKMLLGLGNETDWKAVGSTAGGEVVVMNPKTRETRVLEGTAPLQTGVNIHMGEFKKEYQAAEHAHDHRMQEARFAEDAKKAKTGGGQPSDKQIAANTSQKAMTKFAAEYKIVTPQQKAELAAVVRAMMAKNPDVAQSNLKRKMGPERFDQWVPIVNAMGGPEAVAAHLENLRSFGMGY